LIEIEALWRSSVLDSNAAYIAENTRITVHRRHADSRKIDFEIALRALLPEIKIGGSDDEKGYGGFSARIRMPDGLRFTSETGPVTPQNLQIGAGPWMDFSAPFGKDDAMSGLTLLCHPSSPNFPQTWILRQKDSMQNIVYPGRNQVALSQNDATRLRYRLILHRGPADRATIAKWQDEYSQAQFD
jgi:hypothetical protein